MYSPACILGLLSLVSSAVCGVVAPRQATPRQIVSVPGAWFENIAVRPNGNLLLTRMDVPEVWEYSFATGKAAQVVRFTGDSLAAAGIAELAPDVWAVVTGRYSLTGGGNTPGSWTIHKLDLASGTASAAVVAKLTQSQLINGLAALNATHVLPGDASAGAVYVVDTATGVNSLLKQDQTMKPTGFIPFGIDGMKVHDGYLYFTNIASGGIHRFSVSGGTTGAVQTVVQNNPGDDFVFGSDGLMYLATNNQNSIVKINTATGTVTKLATLSGSTSTVFGRRAGVDQGTLYVATSSGQVLALDVL